MTPAAVLGSSLYLIEILHQTTTKAKLPKYRPTLYLIEILHQTTTLNPSVLFAIELYLIEILHQTTTLATVSPFLLRCILSKFYIKPQLYRHLLSPDSVVSYRNSTSNHNPFGKVSTPPSLYLIEILHQTTTVDGCAVLVLCVVSYRNSTSNHNPPKRKAFVPMLYLIEILHQTTTMPRRVLLHGRCILSKFYIKPQLYTTSVKAAGSCILSKFYIKPQPYKNYYANKQGCILSKFYIKPQLGPHID